MNATLQAAIATHLSISPNQIKSVEEWASVLFVRFTVGRPRFVNKKVTKAMTESLDERIARLEREQDNRADRARNLALEINSHLSIDVPYNKLFSAAVDILEGEVTFDEVVARFSSKKVIKRSN